MTNRKKTIKNKDLAHQDHCDFLENIEKMSMKAYDYVMRRAVQELVLKVRFYQLKKAKKLKKSEDELNKGWTGQVPRVEVNFDKIFSDTIGKYLEALRWILLGDVAGKAAANAAKSLNLENFVIPGIVPSAYLNSIDTHMEHYEDIFGENAPDLQKQMVTESIGQIKDKTNKFLDQSFVKLKNNMIESVNNLTEQVHMENLSAVHTAAHDFLSDGIAPRKAVREAVDTVVSDSIATPKISQALKEAVDRYRNDWGTITRADIGQASAVGTHQAVNEVFGRIDDDVRVAWYAFRDEKTCTFCKSVSKHPDGSFKIYSVRDFQPAGTNFTRKRKDWILCVPPGHYNCRCNLIYIPKGFDIDNNGSIVPSKKP
jgi:hypothetical protein